MAPAAPVFDPPIPCQFGHQLINFGAATLKEGLHRIANNLQPSASPREPITLNESIVENAALEWFGELGYTITASPPPAPTSLPSSNRKTMCKNEE